MSVPVASTPRISGVPVHATRQQLDELDALLQRMLALPVNSAEQAALDSHPDGIVSAGDDSSPQEENRLSEPAWGRPPSPPPATTQGPWRQSMTALPGSTGPAQAQPSYPPSYMVVETPSPYLFHQATGAELNDEAGLGPKRLRGGESPSAASPLPDDHLDQVFEGPISPIGMEGNSASEQPEEGGEWVPLRSSWQPSAQTWKPLAETWEQTRASTPASPAFPEMPAIPPPPRGIPEMPSWRETVIPPTPASDDDTPVPATNPSVPAGVAPPAKDSAENGPSFPPLAAPVPTAPMILAPLVWFNKAFDCLLFPLGPLGACFKGTGGRAVLGTLGLLCMAAAIVLAVAEGFGWTR